MRYAFLRKNHATILACLFSLLLVATSYLSIDATDSINVNLHVEGCNNNYVCEAVIGEDALSCPNDCTYVAPTSTPPEEPEDDEETGGTSGSKVKKTGQHSPLLISVGDIRSTGSEITITWTTTHPSNGSVVWSSGTNYNLGTLQEIGFVRDHSFTLSNLPLNTSYSLTLTATDLYGRVVRQTVFASTQAGPAPSPVVEEVRITQQEGGAVIQWQNPDTDFDYIRIVRSDSFFPSGPFDGEVVYEGSAQSFFDSELEENTRYFYSIFVKSGNDFSPGVLRNFILRPEQDFFGSTGEPVTVFGPIYDSTVITNIDSSNVGNALRIYQEGTEVSRANNTFDVRNGYEVVVAVDKTELIPSSAQVFISYFPSAQMVDGREYVLEYDGSRQKFVTSFTVSNRDQNAPFILYIRNNQEIKGYMGYLSAKVLSREAEEQNWWSGLLKNDLFVSVLLFSFCLIFIAFLWLMLFWTKRKMSEEN